jgi:hypothetical protein
MIKKMVALDWLGIKIWHKMIWFLLAYIPVMCFIIPQVSIPFNAFIFSALFILLYICSRGHSVLFRHARILL